VVIAERFGHYELEQLIGRGGMGEVWRAQDTTRNRPVALKRLHPHLADNVEFQTRFRREAALVARLNEPHVIPIHDYGDIDGRLYIDMRLVEGIGLDLLLHAHGPLSPARAVDIVSQTAGALAAAHGAGLVHRDIKPSNVLLTNEGANGRDFVYLVDFGVAHTIEGTAMTATGFTVGTLAYMAPERFDGHGDHRVDVYALGCLLHEALTAVPPFPVEGLPALLKAHLNTPPPRPSARRPELPAALDAVVATAMAKNPDDRYPSATALALAARDAITRGRAGTAAAARADTAARGNRPRPTGNRPVPVGDQFRPDPTVVRPDQTRVRLPEAEHAPARRGDAGQAPARRGETGPGGRAAAASSRTGPGGLQRSDRAVPGGPPRPGRAGQPRRAKGGCGAFVLLFIVAALVAALAALYVLRVHGPGADDHPGRVLRQLERQFGHD
jgi:hypothetical protein